MSESLKKYISGEEKQEFLDIHHAHPYPAKFHPKVPKKFIREKTSEGDKVLDPYCGCGTTLVESRLLGRNCFGSDTNPLAVFISNAKSTVLSDEERSEIDEIVQSISQDIERVYSDESEVEFEIPEFYNRDHWFQKNVQKELAVIKKHIGATDSSKNIDKILNLAFSAIIVKVSNQESDTRYAAVDKEIKDEETFEIFKKKLSSVKDANKEFSDKAEVDSEVKAQKADARNIEELEDESIDLIVTSPPYANTYDYYLYHKMRMFWLGMDHKEAQEKEIGSRHKYSSKKKDPSNFFENLEKSIKEMERVLKSSKTCVMVIGDSVIDGELYKMDEKIKEIVEKTSFEVEKIEREDLGKYTSFNKSFRNNDKEEYTIQLVKD